MKGSEFDRERAAMAAWMRKHTSVAESEFSARLKRFAEVAYKIGHAAGRKEVQDSFEDTWLKINLTTEAGRVARTAIVGTVGLTILVSIVFWWYLR